MPVTDDPFDENKVLHRGRCHCGLHSTACDRHSGGAAPAPEDLWREAVEGAVVRALFPSDAQRRVFLKAVGRATAFAAISQFFPLATATEVFAEGGAAESPGLRVGFIPITCATPLVLAAAMGVYAKYGLRVELVKASGFASITEKVRNREYDASHMLAPMPLAMTLGLGVAPTPLTMPALENINGSAITLAMKHRQRRDPKDWKGFRLAIPFQYSIHSYLLRYYLAEHGVDPDKDLTLGVVPPANMIGQLKAGEIDGFIVADPFNQRAVYDGLGFIHLLSKEIWDRHPCCAFAVPEPFTRYRPRATKAMLKAIIEATAYAKDPANRKQVAEFISPENYLGQPVEVVEAVLTGKFKDGLGSELNIPDRIDFDTFPWHSFAVWILTQMKRWGQLKGDVDYAAIAQQVYRATETVKLMRESGLAVPETTFKKFYVMSKEFDPAKPDQYAASFAIQHPA